MTAIAALGNLSRDIVAGAPPRPGGGVYYSARVLAHLRADAHAAAACAANDRVTLLPALEAFGLPIHWYESHATTAYSFRYQGDRRVMRQEAVGDPWPPARAIEAVAGAIWVAVCALVRTDFPEETLTVLAAGGRQILIDAHGLVRTPALGPLRTDAKIGGALRHTRILKLNDEEARILVGTTHPEQLRSLGVPEVILTLGSRGSVVVTPTLIERVPVVAVDAHVDPTGAGDTFSAAYLAARAVGAECVEAARSASETVAAFLSER